MVPLEKSPKESRFLQAQLPEHPLETPNFSRSERRNRMNSFSLRYDKKWSLDSRWRRDSFNSAHTREPSTLYPYTDEITKTTRRSILR